MPRKNCPDCNVEPGERHWDSCDVARCCGCGDQNVSCDCPGSNPDIWRGEWPGVAECREYGLWCRRNPNGPGWEVVEAGTIGAREDLNRLGPPDFTWDSVNLKWKKEVLDG